MVEIFSLLPRDLTSHQDFICFKIELLRESFPLYLLIPFENVLHGKAFCVGPHDGALPLLCLPHRLS